MGSNPYAMARPAGQCALLLAASFHPVVIRAWSPPPRSATAWRLQHSTPLPAHRFARFVTSANGGEPHQKPSAAAAPNANFIDAHSKLICCKICISEGRNTSAIAEIDEAAGSNPEVMVLNKFQDDTYNLVRYTLVSYVSQQNSSTNPMKTVLSNMIEAAIANIDLNLHSGAHPRMGVIDDLCFHPLRETEMKDAAELAKDMAIYIGGKEVPVFLYGEAHREKKGLGKLRSELGYYRPDSRWRDSRLPDILMRIKPNEGPTKPTNNFTKLGATTVGAAPFLEGYNVPLRCEDLTKVEEVVTELKNQLGGGGNEGLPKVLAIAILRRDGGIIEVAFLLDPNQVSANQIQHKVEQIVGRSRYFFRVEKGYYTDTAKDMIPYLLNLATFYFKNTAIRTTHASDQRPTFLNQPIKHFYFIYVGPGT